MSKKWNFLSVVLAFIVALLMVGVAAAGPVRDEARSKGLDSLGSVQIPEPPDLGEYVQDKAMAIVLGKALFWDLQVGSDGQACASCHFHAGADNREKNQLTPGLLRVYDPDHSANPDWSFGDESGLTASGQVAGPNYTLKEKDFPFHQLVDPEDRNSEVLFDMNDAASSQGTFDGLFVSVNGFLTEELQFNDDLRFNECGEADGELFNVGGIAVRKVEPRNTPTMINAVFNHRNFWDGRANNIFNGLNPLGERGLQPTPENPNPGTLVMDENGNVSKVQVRIKNASLASQAVGPPLSDFEMSCADRTFADLGQKMFSPTLTPLAFQEIAPDDSVLGTRRSDDGRGLNVSYQYLIMQAFQNKYWAKPGDEQLFDANGEPVAEGPGYTQMEVNFPLFFGLAVQLYEATLVSDQTRFDAFMEGDDNALTEVEKFGLKVFLNEGKCIACHVGAEFTGATVRLRANEPDGNEEPIERMVMGDGGVAVYDGGFYNIGVRPTFEDLGVGADLAGYPLSFARQEVDGPKIDDFNFDTDKFEVRGDIVSGERVAVDGAFKVAGLRNIELTGPYFHNGGQATLRQVVEFYDRGGDRRDEGCGDTTGFGAECSNLDPDIQKLGLGEITRKFGRKKVTAEEALVRFMLALTDERVRWEKAPFDHPQLFIPDGHPGNQLEIKNYWEDGRAVDDFREIPAIGATGATAPLEPFLGVDHFD